MNITLIRTSRIGVCALLFTLALFALAGCASSQEETATPVPTSATETGAANASGTSTGTELQSSIISVDDMPNATVVFGEDTQAFTFVPERNDAALALMRNITETGRNLPIYNYEGFEGDDVMQYYDVPTRYDLPSSPQHVTSEQAGEVYLSDPNRVIVFYRDAQIEGEFTYLGRIENAQSLADAVVNNPVVSGYTNKIISISYAR